MATRKQMPMPAKVKARKAAAALMNGATVQQAVLAAGYSKTTARHCAGTILENIRRELAEQMDALVDRKALVANLLNIATGAKTTERIMHQQTGEVHQFTDTDNYAQVKATELLGKFMGALVRKEEVTVEHNFRLGEEIAKARARVEAMQKQPEITATVIPALPESTQENLEQQEGE